MYDSSAKLMLILSTFCIYYVRAQSRHNSYASILQDTRNEPTPDGTFGYLYKTEDGIVSSARGDPSGKIHGTFSYTDPTGLKVNFNYNAGSRYDNRKNAQAGAATAQTYNSAPARSNSPQQTYREEPQYYSSQPQDDYVEPQYTPRGRSGYQSAETSYQTRRGQPIPKENDVYDDYSYRG